MSINLNYDSVRNICSDSTQVMVYGWKSCKYKEVSEALVSNNYKVFNFRLGHHVSRCCELYTQEGHRIYQIPYHTSNDKNQKIARICKNGVTNLVLENYKRKQQKLPMIPLIFCYDIDGKTRTVTPESIASREPTTNTVITNKELRRCYKLCFDTAKDLDLQDLALVARETIKFVKLSGSATTEYKMELLKPFWEDPQWQTKWDERKATTQPKSVAKKRYWYTRLKGQLAKTP